MAQFPDTTKLKAETLLALPFNYPTSSIEVNCPSERIDLKASRLLCFVTPYLTVLKLVKGSSNTVLSRSTLVNIGSSVLPHLRALYISYFTHLQEYFSLLYFLRAQTCRVEILHLLALGRHSVLFNMGGRNWMKFRHMLALSLKNTKCVVFKEKGTDTNDEFLLYVERSQGITVIV